VSSRESFIILLHVIHGALALAKQRSHGRRGVFGIGSGGALMQPTPQWHRG
jgi:hypothetical protein